MRGFEAVNQLVDMCMYGSTPETPVCLPEYGQVSVVAGKVGRAYATQHALLRSRRNFGENLQPKNFRFLLCHLWDCTRRMHEARGQSSSAEMTTASPVTPTPPRNSSYTAFRLAEKHFKNRATPGHLPTLRDAPSTRPVVDLSRTEKEADDEVWQAGWWGPSDQNVKKGKQRARGERPLLDSPFERIDIGGGKVGHILAEGQ